METCKKEWATERSNGEGIDGKGEGKEKYKEDRQEEWSWGGHAGTDLGWGGEEEEEGGWIVFRVE